MWAYRPKILGLKTTFNQIVVPYAIIKAIYILINNFISCISNYFKAVMILKLGLRFHIFLKCHFKKCKKSCFFGFSKKTTKNVFSNYDSENTNPNNNDNN